MFMDALTVYYRFNELHAEIRSRGDPLRRTHVERQKARAEAENAEAQLHHLYIADMLLRKLGPGNVPGPEYREDEPFLPGMDILDFTLQDKEGRTARWLARHIVTKGTRTIKFPFNTLPSGVDSSVPYFLDIRLDPPGPGRAGALRLLHSKSASHGGFVWARRALDG
jgi:hypothetical protein